MDTEIAFFGIIVGKFFIDDQLQELKTYYNHWQHLVEQLARYTLKMQKALRLMNIRTDIAIREITGKSGMTIIKVS